MNRLAISLCVSLAIAGCKKGEEPAADEASEDKTAAASAQPVEPAIAETEETDEEEPMDLPTEEDFEEEAIEEINAQNLEEELDKLEEEIQG